MKSVPLFSLIIGSSADPSGYAVTPGNNHDDDGGQEAAMNMFWLESHTLCCLKSSSFKSSAEQTFREALPPSSVDSANDNINDKFDMVKQIIGGASCAYISVDGTVDNNTNNDNHYKTATICCREKDRSTTFKLKPSMTNEQIETIGRLSAQIINSNIINAQRLQKLAASNAASVKNNEKDSADGKSWFQSPIKAANKVSSLINYVIDSALNIYDDEDYYATVNDSLDGANDVDDAKANSDSLRAFSFDDTLDDEKLMRKGGSVSNTYGIRQVLDVSDDVISISAVAMTCSHLLKFSQRLNLDDSIDMIDIFAIRDNHGKVERIMLERNGWATGSLASLCQQAGKYFTGDMEEDGIDVSDKDSFIRVRIGKILSTISMEGVTLLAATLCQSNHAIIEGNTITLFPGGIPSGVQPSSKADHALYQIHLTKISTQNRINRLEKDAENARKNAVSCQKKKMTKAALVHMRRRRASLEEIDRCVAILENLSAGELRLERAKSDLQLVQSYTLLKEAFQDIRKSSGMENEEIEELLNDIREEMELANNNALNEAIHNSDLIDEDELNEEFRRLEVECEESKSPRKSDDVAADFPTSEVVDVPELQTSPAKPKIDATVSMPC